MTRAGHRVQRARRRRVRLVEPVGRRRGDRPRPRAHDTHQLAWL